MKGLERNQKSIKLQDTDSKTEMDKVDTIVPCK